MFTNKHLDRPLTSFELIDVSVVDALIRLSIESGLRVGIEDFKVSRFDQASVLKSKSLSFRMENTNAQAILERIQEESGLFEWALMDGIVGIAPKAAAGLKDNPLNLSTEPFRIYCARTDFVHVLNEHVPELMAGELTVAGAADFENQIDIDVPKGSKVCDILNRFSTVAKVGWLAVLSQETPAFQLTMPDGTTSQHRTGRIELFFFRVEGDVKP